MAAYFYQGPIGNYGLQEKNGCLIRFWFRATGLPTGISDVVNETPLLRDANRQLNDYFDGRIKQFDLPMKFNGTLFQQQVWERLKAIPYGETRSYLDIATQLGNPNASRAVGRANHHNPLPIFVPCHRVIGKNGNLIGYAGGISIKILLLELEQRNGQK